MKRTVLLAAVLTLALPAPVSAAVRGPRAIPSHFQWGRCLLEVDGKSYLSGACSYYIGRGGAFEMHGARQTWPGIDYPVSNVFADYVSTDWFAQVDVEGARAEGLWSADIRATHAHTALGTLTRRGACWVNARSKVCLWRR